MEVSLDTMVQMLARSGLIDNAAALTALTRELKCDSASEFTSYLVSKQVITNWPAENLLKGRYKGYFLDQFKLIDLRSGGTSEFDCYLAKDQQTGKRVVLRITRPQRQHSPARRRQPPTDPSHAVPKSANIRMIHRRH